MKKKKKRNREIVLVSSDIRLAPPSPQLKVKQQMAEGKIDAKAAKKAAPAADPYTAAAYADPSQAWAYSTEYYDPAAVAAYYQVFRRTHPHPRVLCVTMERDVKS